jgi:DNA polymerase-1
MIKAIDTETTGLNSFTGDKPFLITSYGEGDPGTAVYIGKDDLIPIDTYLISDNEAVFHNAKFDLHMLEVYGMRAHCKVHDTMVMAHVYNPGEDNKQLKVLAKKYLGEEPTDEKAVKDWLRKNKTKRYDLVPREIMEPYAINDTRITYLLFEFYKKQGVTEDKIYLKEMQLLKCLMNMERRGVAIDTEYCRREALQCEERIAKIEEGIQKEFGDVNIYSNKELKEFLFDKEKLTCNSYTAKGNPSLDAYNLKQYDHPIIPMIIEARELNKVKATYLEGLQEMADSEGSVHCNFYQVGAKTGRFSCREPNLQNIPRGGVIDVRKAFTVRPDYSNFYFDYSQIELRLFAHYSKEPKMIDAFIKGEDLHAMTARALFNTSQEDVAPTKPQRELAKRLNFGIIYGIGAFKFATLINQDYPDMNVNILQAKTFISKYYQYYDQISFFMTKVKHAIMNRTFKTPVEGEFLGYVTDIFGRKYTCPKTEAYKAVNYLIQGCAAGVIKNAMVKIDLLLENKKSNLLLSIHDELVFEIHKEELFLIDKIKDIMEDVDTFRVPLTVNIESTETSWDLKSPYVATNPEVSPANNTL